jgi:hypothetical protein
MANIKISELNPLLTVEDADVLPIVDNAVTKKVTAAILRSYTQGNSVLLTGAQTIAGIKTFTSQLASSVATGTAPFSVASTTKVTNLNADLLDGLSSADFQATLSGTGIVKSTAGTISYLTDNSSNWNTAFNDSIVSAAVTGTTTKLLTLNQQDGGTITASWTDDNTDAVTSVFGRTGAVVATSGDYTTTQVTEGTNLYFTDARARAAISLTTTGTSGVATYVSGVLNIPNYGSALSAYVPYTGATTNVDLGVHSLTASDLVINHASGSGVAASITKGGAGEALTVVKSSGSGNAASITGGTTLISELNLTTDLADAYIASAATWNAKQNAITLTTTGTSGAATLVGATLNIPNYGTALASYLPLAGGTLTGALNINTSTAGLVLNRPSVTTFTGTSLLTGGAGQWFVGMRENLSSNDYIIYNESGFDNFKLDKGTGAATFSSSVTASSLIKSGGTSSQYLMADGSTSTLTNPITGTGTTNYLPKFTGASALGNSILQEGTNVIGVGVTPTAWGSGYSSLQVSNISLFGSSALDLNLASNMYLDNVGYKYISSGYASLYNQYQGKHFWSTAGTGTAGNAISFTEVMTLDASGKLGLGVTPSAWDANFKALQIGIGTALYNNTSVNGTFLGSNFYYNGTDNKYIATGTATAYGQINGSHNWFTVASGTAGDTVNFTQAMTLTASGNLGIGTPTPASKLNVLGAGTTAISISNSNPGTNGSPELTQLNFLGFQQENRARIEAIDIAGSANGSQLRFYNANLSNTLAENMRIAQSGNVLIGTTTDAGYKLDVNGTARVGVLTATLGQFSQTISTTSNAESSGSINFLYATNANSRTWRLANDVDAYGDFAIQQSTTRTGSTFVNKLIFSNAGDATFSGAIAINNPVNAAVAVASTHKVTIEIGGVTYYLLATNV